MGEGVELVVVACNTASSYALEVLEETLPVPVFGVVEPGVKCALKTTKNKKVGVVGTRATVSSGAYKRLLEKEGAEVFQKACPLFVPLVEEGLIEGEIPKRVVAYYLEDLKESGIDTLILGCTHYPLLKPLIEDFMGPQVKVIDSAQSTALEIEAHVLREGSASFELYFTDESPSLGFLIELLLGAPAEYKRVSLPCKV
jgi:glutamate racemase